MKLRPVLFVGAIALSFAIGLGMTAHSKTSEVERWEFQTLHGAPSQLAGYNAYGNNGWELAAVSCQENFGQCAYFFKRRK